MLMHSAAAWMGTALPPFLGMQQIMQMSVISWQEHSSEVRQIHGPYHEIRVE